MRSAISSGGGTRYGMPASRIFARARTSLLDMVASETRKARAISPVVSPATVRKVSATLASIGRAGWRQVWISRSRSSSAAGSLSLFRQPFKRGEHRELAAAPAFHSPHGASGRSPCFWPPWSARPPGSAESRAPANPPRRAQTHPGHSPRPGLQSPVTRIRVAVIRAVSSAEAASTAASTSLRPGTTSSPPGHQRPPAAGRITTPRKATRA